MVRYFASTREDLARLAFDGLDSTSWISGDKENQWVAVEFDEKMKINKAVLTQHIDRDYGTRNFNIEYSDDSTTWFKAITGDLIQDVLEVAIAEEGYHKFWRLYVFKSGGSSQDIAIKEVKFIGESEPAPDKKLMILKSPTTNQYYSLAEKTLIPLPDASDKNMILYGIKADQEIELDVDFDKASYVVEENMAKTQVKPLSIKLSKVEVE